MARLLAPPSAAARQPAAADAPVRVLPLARGTRLTLKAGCALVIDGRRHLLVDPGCFPTRAALESALRRAVGIGVADLDAVFFTHLHFDHYADLGFGDVTVLVPRAELEAVRALVALRADLPAYRAHLERTHEVLAPVFMRQFVLLRDDPRYDFAHVSFRARLRTVEAGDRLLDRLQTIDLAGHSAGQLGLRMRTVHGDTALVGDAALSAEDYARADLASHLVVQDRARMLASRAVLTGLDCAIPSHGAWFAPRTGTAIEPVQETCHA